jgi:hypothetical protein
MKKSLYFLVKTKYLAPPAKHFATNDNLQKKLRFSIRNRSFSTYMLYEMTFVGEVD